MDDQTQAQSLVAQMTLEEKAQLLSGQGWWNTHAIERLGVESIFLTDGPHGVRKAPVAGLGDSVPATCFPTASAMACSWNVELMRQIGQALGRECQAHDVQILLGPGINIKRSPLGGRNFEYFSEDPHLSGKMAAAWVQGVQSEGVGASLKHFAVNSQEHERMSSDSCLDDRTLHEIYLKAFEIAVKESRPWSVMCSYNLVNGEYASESRRLLTQILREQWGFEGFVVSDWGAVNERLASLRAGLNLEMPGSGDYHQKKIIAAVEQGHLSPECVDQNVEQLLAVILKALAAKKPTLLSPTHHHELARKAAAESCVLLKNNDNLLPLDLRSQQKVAVIGEFAKNPRYQGAGSSQVKASFVSSAWNELSAQIPPGCELTYAAGYDADGDIDGVRLQEALQVAQAAHVCLLFVGLPESAESEGFDRRHMDLPLGHQRLLQEVLKVQPRTVVILVNGSAVTMPWLQQTPAVLESWLCGQAGGAAVVDILTGKTNPSGKLAETFPQRLEDTPTAGHFPEEARQVHYREGVFVGYRHYDDKHLPVNFPFGFGLSYTQFAITGHEKPQMSVGQKMVFSVRVQNTGAHAGHEVVQVYTGARQSLVERPVKELKAFQKVFLQAGEEKVVAFELQSCDFAFYDVSRQSWQVPAGNYVIFVGSSSRELPVQWEVPWGDAATHEMTRKNLLKDVKARSQDCYHELVQAIGLGDISSCLQDLPTTERQEKEKKRRTLQAFLDEMPLQKVPAFSEGRCSDEKLQAILNQLNVSN